MTVRTITNFRELNKRIVRRPYPIPKISTTLQELEGFTYATALDLNCRSPDSWSWTDHSQISLFHSPTPPKCSTRAIVALINNLGIVCHQYCSSSHPPDLDDKSTGTTSTQLQSSRHVFFHPLRKKHDCGQKNGLCWENDQRPTRLPVP